MLKLTSTAALVLGIAAASAHAAELGEATVRSHAGEQLVADVELVDLTPQDLADLQVRLASRNVFQGANVSMSPALASMNITVTKRDGRRVLHLTTSAPVQAEVLHLYFELTSAGRQSVRGVSLWLPAAPPAPPAPAPVPVAQPTRVVAAPVVAPAPEPAPRPRPAGIAVQLAAVGTPGRQASKAETELMGAVERAFAARSAGKTAAPAAARAVPAVETKVTEKPASTPIKGAEKPVSAAPKVVEKPALAEHKVAEKSASAGHKLTDKPAPAEHKAAEKPAPADHKIAEKSAPASAKATGKTAPAPSKSAEKPAISIVPPLPVIAKPTEAVPARPEADKAMLKKLAELEAKLKSLQAAVAKNAATPPAAAAPATAPATTRPPGSKAPVPTAAAPAAVPAGHVEQSAAVITATEPPGRTAAGKITDARADKAAGTAEAASTAAGPREAGKPATAPALAAEGKDAAPAAAAEAKNAAPAAAVEATKGAQAPAPEAKKVAPPRPEEPVKEKKMSRPKVLTMIAAGSTALLFVVGVIVHLVRRRKARQASAQIKVWQSWRKKAIAEAATAEEEAPAAAEAGAA